MERAVDFVLADAQRLLEATIIRIVLVPAMMRLMGDWNWWLPPFLAKVLPKVELESEGYVAASPCRCRPADCRCGAEPCTCGSPALAPAHAPSRG